jgi:hypothetical protein
MNPRVSIKKGDTRPYIDVTVTQESDGSALNLTSADATFSMKNKRTGAAKVTDQVADIYDAINGKLRYDLKTGDVDTEGTYLGEFTITLSGGGIVSIPHFGHIEIYIGEAQ